MATRSTRAVLPVLRAADSGFEAAFEKLVRRREDKEADVGKAVRRSVDRVRDGGDAELLACVRKYDGATLDALEIQPAEIEQAGESIDPAARAARVHPEGAGEPGSSAF